MRGPLIIETISITSLQLDPSNVRKHSDKNLSAIKGSLKKFGQQKPIVVGEHDIVIAGNGTLEAAKALGWKDIQVVKTDLKGSEAIAFAISDNRTTDLSIWDADGLAITLRSLLDEDYAVSELGWSSDDLNAIFTQDELGFAPGPTIDTDSDATGDTQRIMLFYSNDDFKLLLPVVEQLCDDLKIADMSELFKKLVYDAAKAPVTR